MKSQLLTLRAILNMDAEMRRPLERKSERWRLARKRIVMLLRKDPVMSNASVARATGTERRRVAKVRQLLESQGEIPEIHKRRGSDGRIWGHKK